MKMRTDLIDVFIQPGEYLVVSGDYRLRTMLGSCVSITLWHPRTRVGAMSHFLLPSRGAGEEDVHALDARYGDEALRLMVDELERMGVRPSECQAKMFGGGNMFPEHSRAGIPHVGRRNGDAARELLAKYGIPVVSESLFGDGHRQIIFDVSTGDVWSYQPGLTLNPSEGLPT